MDLFGSSDHQVIGRIQIALASLFGVVGLLATASVGLTGVHDGWAASMVDANQQLFTLGRVLLVVGFALPLPIGLMTIVVPRQVGARRWRFPAPRPQGCGPGRSRPPC
jgi:heme/copper-type cytochrome/quinol oxidase subunit 1